jgi:hypothetical protein
MLVYNFILFIPLSFDMTCGDRFNYMSDWFPCLNIDKRILADSDLVGIWIKNVFLLDERTVFRHLSSVSIVVLELLKHRSSVHNLSEHLFLLVYCCRLGFWPRFIIPTLTR